MPEIKLLHGDCMAYMSTLPDKYFDLAIVDPPYGIEMTKMNMGGRRTIAKDTSKTWDSAVPSPLYFLELFRCSKRQIIWGGNYFVLPPSQYFAIWDKGESMYGRDFAECEYAWCSGGGTRIYKCSPVQLDRIHPTQKPVRLYRWLLHHYAKPGERIFDTHLGSGSIAVACHDMGYDLTALEIDKEYYDAACKRFRNASLQIKLF